MAQGVGRLHAAVAMAPAHGLQNALLAFQAADLGAGEDFDIGQRADALHQILRHGGFQIAAPAPASRPSWPGPPDRPRPGLPNCRPPPAPPHARRRAGFRSARPSSARRCLRSRTGWRFPAAGSAPPAAITTLRLAHTRLAIAQTQAEACAVILVGVQPRRLVGDGDLGAEFLRLVIGPRHQGDAGDAGGKAQIILDPRRGPPAWPPKLRQSTTRVARPSEAA